MGRADARAGLHGGDRFDAHGQVDDDAVAAFHTQRRQRVGELADARVQVGVGGNDDLTVVRLEDDRWLVCQGRQVTVNAVVRDVELAVVEPLVERGLRLIQHRAEGLGPNQMLACEARPERFGVAIGFSAEGLVGVGTRDGSAAGEFGGGREYASLVQ